jgi:hypothetical protein
MSEFKLTVTEGNTPIFSPKTSFTLQTDNLVSPEMEQEVQAAIDRLHDLEEQQAAIQAERQELMTKLFNVPINYLQSLEWTKECYGEVKIISRLNDHEFLLIVTGDKTPIVNRGAQIFIDGFFMPLEYVTNDRFKGSHVSTRNKDLFIKFLQVTQFKWLKDDSIYYDIMQVVLNKNRELIQTKIQNFAL